MKELLHITVRPKGTGLEADCTIDYEDDLPPYRVRRQSPHKDVAKTQGWAEGLCMRLWKKGRPLTRKQKRQKLAAVVASPQEITLESLSTLYLKNHVLANGGASATHKNREWAFRVWLTPRFGSRELSSLGDLDYQQLKGEMRDAGKKPVTINRVLSTLWIALKVAVRWRLLASLPEKPEKLEYIQDEIEIYSIEEYDRLVVAASLFPLQLLVVLLGGEAGLRVGELRGLRWIDVDLVKRELIVRQQVTVAGEIKPPKFGKPRKVPLSRRLTEALTKHRHLGDRVLAYPSGSLPSHSGVAYALQTVERRAGVIGGRSPHKLRHTFASLLLASGANLKQVQKLLGHTQLATTQKYLHLLPSAEVEAIRLLDQRHGAKVDSKS